MNEQLHIPGIGSHQSAKSLTDVWLTPLPVLSALGKFDLDPCAAPEPRPWPTASTMWSDNGLGNQWFGRVWLNPPYSDAGPWMKRLAAHRNGVALIFARVETGTWWDYIWDAGSGADAVMFLRTRLKFCRPDGSEAACNSGAPSALVAYGPENARAVLDSGIVGVHVFKWARTGV